MADEVADIHLTGEDEAGHLLLEREIRGIAADEVFFINAYGGQIDASLHTAPRVGKQERLAAAAKELLGLENGGVRRHCDDGGIESAAISNMGDVVGEVGVIDFGGARR